jgi:hypothetical protein
MTGTGSSVFNSVAVDSTGNVYAAGYQYGTGSFDYGNGVSKAGAYSGGSNAVLVKYNSSGAAQWAQSVSGSTSYSEFNSVAVDSTGNVYAAGYQYGTGSFDYGNSKTAQGPASNENVVLVKYNPSGDTQWAKSVTAGPTSSYFNSVAVDSAGTVYAAGYQGSGSFDYGGSKTAQGPASSNNVVLVKYNSSGEAQWARSVSGSTSNSLFSSVAVDSGGNVYAAGRQAGTGTFDYGNGVTSTGTYSGGNNVLLVKYSSSGDAQWARSLSAGTDVSVFHSVAAGGASAVYAAGQQWGTGIFNYGNGVTSTGTYSGGGNILLVKYIE